MGAFLIKSKKYAKNEFLTKNIIFMSFY